MFDTEDPWISHKDLKVTKDMVAIHVDTRDFSLVTSTDDSVKVNIDLKIVGDPKFSFTTQQVKAVINKLYKESGGEKDWRFLHFIDESKKLIIGGNWQFKYLSFYKCKPNTWICKPREDLPATKKEVFDLMVFGDLMASHNYSKKKGWIKEDSQVDQKKVDQLKKHTRKSKSQPRSKQQKVYKPRAKRDPKRRAAKKVHRNDPCTCGSGKKFKRCCGSNK